jgi:hypothetical protein
MQSILVVDDDIAACMVIERMVRLLGYECDMVHDGADDVLFKAVNRAHLRETIFHLLRPRISERLQSNLNADDEKMIC